MGVNLIGTDDLLNDLTRMAREVNDSGKVKAALKDAAQPIYEDMKQRASRDPQIITDALHAAIKVGYVSMSSLGSRITIGVHRRDFHPVGKTVDEYYPAYVEYGHGGPAPAPAHPYIRPAYDTKEKEAYRILKAALKAALK